MDIVFSWFIVQNKKHLSMMMNPRKKTHSVWMPGRPFVLLYSGGCGWHRYLKESWWYCREFDSNIISDYSISIIVFCWHLRKSFWADIHFGWCISRCCCHSSKCHEWNRKVSEQIGKKNATYFIWLHAFRIMWGAIVDRLGYRVGLQYVLC